MIIWKQGVSQQKNMSLQIDVMKMYSLDKGYQEISIVQKRDTVTSIKFNGHIATCRKLLF